ncbi:hypothetical protein D3C87_1982030 [compost metagenome]
MVHPVPGKVEILEPPETVALFRDHCKGPCQIGQIGPAVAGLEVAHMVDRPPGEIHEHRRIVPVVAIARPVEVASTKDDHPDISRFCRCLQHLF